MASEDRDFPMDGSLGEWYSSGAGPSNLPKHPKRFKIMEWNAVALWAWDIKAEVCSICRNHLTDPCVHCMVDAKGDECVVALGVCNHAFHSHCISRWLQNRLVCPLDNSDWQLQKIWALDAKRNIGNFPDSVSNIR